MIDIIIIGGGAAGMTAALYALRNKKEVLIFENESFGGQIASSPRIENFPSIKEISGLDFSNNLFNQISDLGANFEFEEVLSVTKDKDIFTVTGEYSTYQAKSVIIACGVKHRRLGVPKEDELIGSGVSYCAVCDGAFYEGKNVAVIGDANSALQYALMLANLCPKVILCTLFDRFFGDKTLIERIKERKNIEIIHNISLDEYLTNQNELTGLRFHNTQTNENVIVNCSGVFVAIGQIPNNERYKNILELNQSGYIITNENCETNISGLYAAGDCRVKNVRQLTTAVSDGAICAVNAVTYIDKNL